MRDSSEVAFNLQGELLAAQSELAALREENERLKSESFEELYNAAIDERDALREELAQARDDLSAQRNHFRAQLANAKDADEIQQRLTAAEQRNSELVELLAEHQWEWQPYDDHYHRDGGYYCLSCKESKNDGHAKGCAIDAALKPTESGASE